MKSISNEAIDALSNAQIDGSFVRLTGQLDRKVYVEVNEVLSRLGGVWKSGRIKAHVFPDDADPALLIDSVVSSEMMPDKNPLAFFPTPPDVVRLMLNSAKLSLFDGATVLEPSAGEGAIAEMALTVGSIQLQLIEKDPDRAEKLKQKGFSVQFADFLLVNPQRLYDCVLMNPPFALKDDPKAYITHILHAWQFVKSGGRLVAIAPVSFIFSSDKKSRSFRTFVESVGAWQELPDGAFKPHTGVKTALITLLA